MTGTPTARIDLITVVGIAAVVYVVSTLGHEGLGHGGMCMALGQKPLVWGAYYFECADERAAPWVWRAVAAAGSTVNLIIMIIAFLLLKADLSGASTKPRGAGTVFLWLMFALNGFEWAGYYCFSGVADIGDWADHDLGVLQGLPYALPARAIMAVAGGLCYFLIGRTAGRLLGRIMGGDRRAGMKLAWTAYVTGAVVAISIGFMNPVGIVIVLVSSAASSLGGTSGFLWQHRFMQAGAETGFALRRSHGWLAAGLIAATAYAVVFGHSLKFA